MTSKANNKSCKRTKSPQGKLLSQRIAEAKQAKLDKLENTKLINEMKGVGNLARIVYTDMVKQYKAMKKLSVQYNVFDEFAEAADPALKGIKSMQDLIDRIAKTVKHMESTSKQIQTIQLTMDSVTTVQSIGNEVSEKLKELEQKLNQMAGIPEVLPETAQILGKPVEGEVVDVIEQ